MPQPRRVPSNGVPNGTVTPEEAAQIRASVAKRETAPSTREQAGGIDWARAQSQLGQPFNVERIPLDKLKLMRRDPILGFGLSYLKIPAARANWYAKANDENGPNAQISAHFDHDLRRIWGALCFLAGNRLDFGFQSMVKRWELGIPAGTYVETGENGELEEKKIWDEGTVEPIRFKPFVGLPPELVEPKWNGAGEFDGIIYKPPKTGDSTSAATEKKYDVAHSLWTTNEQESVFGSLYGYPRLGYAYQYWWSYWFRWAIADRAFEKRADPSTLVRHPEGSYVGPDGETIDYRELALSIGEQLRSGATVAMPSTTYVGDLDGKPSTVHEWSIEFLKGGTDLEPFDKSFDYLDIAKLRSLWIPEQAFFEGKGGTSSRNVASEQRGNLSDQQDLLANDVAEIVNRWVAPQWLAVNYPEVAAAGGSVRVVVKGFSDKDVEQQRQILQLLGQQERGQREMLTMVDLRKMLEEAGTPLLSYQEQQRRNEEIIAETQATAPPPIEPVPGEEAGVVPTATGFSYIQPREVIYLSDTSSDFLSNLPNSPHYQDRTIKRHARQMWQVWRDAYRDDYEAFATFVEDLNLTFAEDDTDEDEQAILRRAQRMVQSWRRTRDVGGVMDKTSDLLRRILGRAASITRSQARIEAKPPEDDLAAYIEARSQSKLAGAFDTTSDELTDFIAKQLRAGVDEPRELAKRVREHFASFADWKADRLVRTEVRDAYNMATLLQGKAGGVEIFQAADAQDGDTDPDCQERDGKLFPFEEAVEEEEHPNGTLTWIPVKRRVEVERVAASEDQPVASFDEESGVITFTDAITNEQERVYLKAIVEMVNA